MRALTSRIVTRINFATVASALATGYTYIDRHGLSRNYKNSTAIVNLRCREFCHCRGRFWKRTRYLQRDASRNYGDRRVILIRDISSCDMISLKRPRAKKKSAPRCEIRQMRGSHKKEEATRTYDTTFRYLSVGGANARAYRRNAITSPGVIAP